MLTLMRYVIFVIALFIFPDVAFSDQGKAFRENSDSIVVVTAYNKKGEELTEGTGFIARKDGIVVTNFHVVAIASQVKVRAGQKVMNIEGVVHADKEHDLIVLKVRGQDLPAARIGRPDSLRKGDRVHIISSSGDRKNIVTDGLFQGMQELSRKRKTLKIDAAVTHGSSGSPVFNQNGEVVGIVTFLIRRSQDLILAMPVDLIRDKVSRPLKVIPEKTALRTYKKLPEYWYHLGYFLMEAGAREDAMGVLKEAVKMRPGYADAHYLIGSVHEASKQDMKAFEAYRKAVKADPGSSDAYFSLGITCGRLGKYTEAVDALKQAVRLEPGYADAHYNLGIAYLFLKDRESARAEYRILKEISPGSAQKLLGLIDN